MQAGPGLLKSRKHRDSEAAMEGMIPPKGQLYEDEHLRQQNQVRPPPQNPFSQTQAESPGAEEQHVSKAWLEDLSKASTNYTYQPKTTCLVNTGGNCTERGCAKFRGETTCDRNRCMCTAGACSGADGICTGHDYAVVLDDFTIRDLRYGRYLSASETPYRITMTDKKSDQRSRFRLVETHDGAFIIYSKANPDNAITIGKAWSPNYWVIPGTATKFSAMQSDVKGQAWNNDDWDPSVRNIALTLTQPPSGYDDSQRPVDYPFKDQQPIMLQSFRYPKTYICSDYYPELFGPYVGGTPSAAARSGDQGDGCLFVFDPPLPKEWITSVKHFSGDACDLDCHGSWSWGFWLILGSIGLCICGPGLFCFCKLLCCCCSFRTPDCCSDCCGRAS